MDYCSIFVKILYYMVIQKTYQYGRIKLSRNNQKYDSLHDKS